MILFAKGPIDMTRRKSSKQGKALAAARRAYRIGDTRHKLWRKEWSDWCPLNKEHY